MFLEISCLSKNKSNKANIKLTFILQKKKASKNSAEKLPVCVKELLFRYKGRSFI